MRARTIYRLANGQTPRTTLANRMHQDKRLSIEARGFLGSILSRPIDWGFNLAWLMREHNIGREKARRLLRECECHGYCHRQRARSERGTLIQMVYVFTDDPEAFKKQFSEPEPENPSTGDLTTGDQTLVSQRLDNAPHTKEIQSKEQRDKKKGGMRSRTGTDGSLSFSAEVIQAVKSLGVEADVLVDRYLAKTKGKQIRDPDAYLLAMAHAEHAKTVDLSPTDIKACAVKNRSDRARNMAIVSGAFNCPTDALLSRARSTRGQQVVDQALAAIKTRGFTSQSAVDRAFNSEIANVVLRTRQDPATATKTAVGRGDPARKG